jgi:hypothetical protein
VQKLKVMLEENMIKKNKGNRRKTGKEQFYTLPEVADQCVEIMLKHINKDDSRFLEPAGGKGSFIDSLIRHGVDESQIVSFDIEPLHPLIIDQDFLTLTDHDLGIVYVSFIIYTFLCAFSLFY